MTDAEMVTKLDAAMAAGLSFDGLTARRLISDVAAALRARDTGPHPMPETCAHCGAENATRYILCQTCRHLALDLSVGQRTPEED
jgi:hypothetical protein